MTTPFTYLIGWPELDIWYYGVRYAKGCHPDDLWSPYKTSSKHVAEFIAKHGDPDIIQVRKTFIEVPTAQNWENRVLKRLKVVSSDKWLNRTDNKSIAPQYGEDHPHYGKKGESHHSYGKPNPAASKTQTEKWANPNIKHPWSDPEFIAKRVADHSGDNHHMKRSDVVDKVSGKNNWIYKKAGALEARSKQFIEMNKARRGTHYRRVDCTHCGKDYSSVQIKQHEKRCETNLARLVGHTD